MRATEEDLDYPATTELTEGLVHPDLDPMLLWWPKIASVAWEGFCKVVGGVVHISVLGEATNIAYRSLRAFSSTCPLVGTYDPEAKAVTAVERGDEVNVHVIGGWPPAPVVCAFAPVELLEGPLH